MTKYADEFNSAVRLAIVTQATYWPSGAPSVLSAFGINNWWTYNSMLQV